MGMECRLCGRPLLEHAIGEFCRLDITTKPKPRDDIERVRRRVNK